MDVQILHSGFDGLKFTLQSDISPELRTELAAAKDHARKAHGDYLLEFGNIILNIINKGARGFTAHTGDHGAIWLFQNPEDRIPNNPAITVDLRAFGLATGGLEGAERHFRDCMEAFGFKYVETQLRAGAVANRQLAIYDKRAEIIQTNKLGWLPIWRSALKAKGKPPLDLNDRTTSQVWRFEMRLGSKQLRNRFELRNWQDSRHS